MVRVGVVGPAGVVVRSGVRLVHVGGVGVGGVGGVGIRIVVVGRRLTGRLPLPAPKLLHELIEEIAHVRSSLA